ncbi:MAG: hypothetical protein C4320_06825, partial [Armatimonadota bacterium]
VGGVAGAIGSGVAVAAVDAMDNDNNISGVGSGVNYNDDHYRSDYSTRYATTGRPYEDYQPAYRYGTDAARNASWHGHDYMSAESQIRADYQARFPNRNYDHDSGAIRSGFEYGRGSAVAAGGNQIPGIQTGGVAHDGTPDTRGMTEKVADKLTGDHVDDKTGKIV